MIADPERTIALSSLGWVDHDALWVFDVVRRTTSAIPLATGARYASLHYAAGSQRFAVAHHFDGVRYEISVREFTSPGEVRTKAVVEDGQSRLEGDLSAWTDVPRLYVEYLAFAPWKDFVLLRVSPSTGTVEIQRLPWYDDSYDKDYQGVVGALELPNRGSALISVQRSSRLILHDLNTGTKIRSIDLGRRAGNPTLTLRNAGHELWASNYDTLEVVRTSDWQVDRSRRLQGAMIGAQEFIGEYAFAPNDDLCVVARPFSGDVIGVDVRNLKIRQSAKVGRQPMEVTALGHDDVVARDWKTGQLLRGTLKRRWFAR